MPEFEVNIWNRADIDRARDALMYWETRALACGAIEVADIDEAGIRDALSTDAGLTLDVDYSVTPLTRTGTPDA